MPIRFVKIAEGAYVDPALVIAIQDIPEYIFDDHGNQTKLNRVSVTLLETGSITIRDTTADDVCARLRRDLTDPKL